MKKSRFLFILPLLASFVLTSCDLLNNLNFGGPRRRSSREEESQLVDDESRHEHHWGDWRLTKEATCTVNGEERRECQICGQVETRIVSRTGHLWGDWMETIAATCTDSGLKERYCTRCGSVEQKYSSALGHIFDEGQWFTITEPTCYMNGIQENRCQRCGEVTQREIPALEHNWSYSSGTIEPTCTTDGYYIRRCTVCGLQEEEVAPAIGHDLEIIGSDAMPKAGKAQVRLYKCVRCDVCFLGFNVNDVSNASKEHLVFETDYNGETGARFWGRPIGNALALSYDGVSVNQQSDECVYCSTETGDYFEYVFDLTEEQAALLSNCRLYCDAKPASYLNGTDFWAYGRSDTDWTPGYYIDGGDERFETNEDGSFVMVNDHARAGRDSQQGVELDTKVKLGKRIEGYRYVLYVDGNVVDFDPDILCPTHGNNTNMVREEFAIPYTFHLHEGENRIRLHMAGGYRSTFYNFIFKPCDELTPIQVDQSNIEVREGKTAKITSSMTGLTYQSSNTSIATVDANGLITGVKAGTATITVSKEGNYRNARIAVTVLEKEGIVTLNLDDGVIAPENGFEVYNSSSSGQWFRNPKKDATLTYRFTSELAGLYDLHLNLRGSGIILAENFNIKVNGVDLALPIDTLNASFTPVDTIVGKANLVVGENSMVITVLADNNLYLQSLKFVPHDFNETLFAWSCEDLEANRTDSGWAASKDFGGEKAFKFNKAGSVNLTYVSDSAQTVMLQLKLAVKYANRNNTFFWKQNNVEKTRITINGAIIEAGAEPDFSNVTDSGVSDSGNISIPEWFNIMEIDLVAGENTIKVEFLTGGYSYYLGGMALAK